MSPELARRICAPAYYLAAFALAVLVIASANDAAGAYESLAARQSASARADQALRNALEILSLGVYRGASEQQSAFETTLERARRLDARAAGAGWALLGASAAFLALVIGGAPRGRRLTSPAAIRHVLGVSAVFLLVGLLAPVLTVVAQEEVAVLGRVVLQHEAKGIVTTIHKLYHVRSYFVAALLALFSVALPALKIVASLLALHGARAGARRFGLLMVNVIGRWSMTDVFVVAILLAFLTADTAQLTDASVGPGLYFFAGYGLLSMAAGHMMLAWQQGEVHG